MLKCWPFDETKTEFIEAFLPPITVQKFKWWADGLDNKEAEAVTNGLSCPVCLVFTAGTTTAVNTHVDRCLAQSSRKEQIRMKSKSRVPKKRSIVEIFAVAPQVEKLYDDEDADEDEDGGDFLSTEDDDDVKLSALIHVGSNDKRKKKMKLEDRTLAIVTKLKKLKGVKKNKNGKKERDIAPIDLSVPNKVCDCYLLDSWYALYQFLS